MRAFFEPSSSHLPRELEPEENDISSQFLSKLFLLQLLIQARENTEDLDQTVLKIVLKQIATGEILEANKDKAIEPVVTDCLSKKRAALTNFLGAILFTPEEKLDEEKSRPHQR